MWTAIKWILRAIGLWPKAKTVEESAKPECFFLSREGFKGVAHIVASEREENSPGNDKPHTVYASLCGEKGSMLREAANSVVCSAVSIAEAKRLKVSFCSNCIPEQQRMRKRATPVIFT